MSEEKNLIDAIKNGNLAEVKRILEIKPELADLKCDGIWISMEAARLGYFDVVKYMVEYSRAHMNIVDDNNRNMLHYAAMSGNLDMVRYMTEKVGLSPVEGDFDRVTPYEIVTDKSILDGKYNNDEVAKYFEEYIGCKLDDMYKNPIRCGMFPDPSIVRVDEDYYMVNSSFIYFPCIPISHSRDLVNWEIIGYAITNPEWANIDDLEGGRGYWAPDISYHNGEFYITATYRLNDYGTVYRKQVVVHSPKPEGPYSKPAIIDEDGIDPSLFWEDDRCYMLLNRGARIFELDSKAERQISEAQMLYYGAMRRGCEGPHLLKKDGWYYLFEAEGGTGIGHRETVARSKTLFGNYEPCPYNPILRQEDDNAGIRRCGHGKPVQTPDGEWYMVYLCGRMVYDSEGFGMSILGRETCLDKITWTADGWPIVNNRRGPSNLAPMPVKGTRQIRGKRYAELFRDKLGLEWVTPRTTKPEDIVIKDGRLYVKSSPKPLSDVGARNILLRRQESFSFEASVVIDLSEIKPYEEVGLTCYYDENTYLTFSVADGKLQVKEHIGEADISHDAVMLEKQSDKIELRVETDYLKREFSYRTDDGEFKHHTTIDEVKYLCDEGIKMGKRFTGAMVGVYAYSDEHSFYGVFERYEQIER